MYDLVRETTQREATLTVVDRESVRPLYRILTDLFDGQAVEVRDVETEYGDGGLSDAVVMSDEDGVAVSPLRAVNEEILLVNADIYVTGTRGLDDIETPDVFTELDDIEFEVTATDETFKEKLLLIEMSRHIESLAHRHDGGRLHTGFQSLSRLADEPGTRRVYERVGAETATDVYAYGVPDARPSIPGVTLRGRDDPLLRRTWFVCYESEAEAAAMVAEQTDRRTYEGLWTYDRDRVTRVIDHLDGVYSEQT